ncbi:MAG: glycosyltransferase family 4 protein, partial [Candidatus Peribacteraceae bacterium]|nr:glycosyltransferase family 4 protein [Candidatus Peribacteraceae bacterium]
PTMNLEAMAAGKPVVATCFGGSSEIVEDGETGFVVNPRDIDNLVQALGTILKDEKKAKEMGDKGREIIKESFSVEKQVEGYLGVLN